MSQMIKGNTGDLTAPSPLVGEGRGEGASLLNNAKELRINMTDAEQKLWYQLRAKRFEQYKFRRQVPMEKFIVDFICFQAKLIIELDDGQHTMQQEYDQKRNQFFLKQGFRILRFWNNEVLENMEGVLQMIANTLSPLPNPSPTGGEGL